MAAFPLPYRVLVVNDHDDARDLTVRVLARCGFPVAGVGTFAASLTCARERQFDVLINDVNLPDGTGLELLPRMRELNPAIVGRRARRVVSGDTQPELRDQVEALGVQG